MTTNAWPIEMAPTAMLPDGMSQQWLYNRFLQRFQIDPTTLPSAPPVWPTPVDNSPGLSPFNIPRAGLTPEQAAYVNRLVSR